MFEVLSLDTQFDNVLPTKKKKKSRKININTMMSGSQTPKEQLKYGSLGVHFRHFFWTGPSPWGAVLGQVCSIFVAAYA